MWIGICKITLPPTAITDNIYRRGNVGIGNNLPTAKIHVIESDNATSTAQIQNTGTETKPNALLAIFQM